MQKFLVADVARLSGRNHRLARSAQLHTCLLGIADPKDEQVTLPFLFFAFGALLCSLLLPLSCTVMLCAGRSCLGMLAGQLIHIGHTCGPNMPCNTLCRVRFHQMMECTVL